MSIDPTNPVVTLCAEGMRAEAERRFDEAKLLFQEAWGARRSDYEAAIAAHYLARHQPSLEEALAWNRSALEHALAADPEETRDFLPSLYLNLAHSHEMLADLAPAERYRVLGVVAASELPATPYADVVRDGLRRMGDRLALAAPGSRAEPHP